ncbi:MAG: hypothetical protein ACLQVY_30315 [Limisphaerales bacterium]
MSASQTLIFVALPNGTAGSGNLKLSIYLTPRLEGGATQTLADFPDFLNWPQSIQAKGLKFQIACGSKTSTVSATAAVLRPDICQAIFTRETYVEPYAFPGFSGRLIVSYPVRQIHDTVKSIYQYFNFARGREVERSPLLAISEPFMFRDENNQPTLDESCSQMRLEMWNEQNGQAAAGPPAAHDAITRFALFHNLPPAYHRPPLPATAADFAKTLDFHSALTALSSYPSLLRALGLVFDVEVPASLCPASPNAGAYGTISVGGVTPGFPWQIAPQFNFWGTSYWLDKNTFRAAPGAPPSAQAAGNYSQGDVFGGWLALPPDQFYLQQLDLDGATLKLLGLADNVDNTMYLTSQNTNQNLLAIENALPSLRSAGVSLIADGRGGQLLQSIQDNGSFNQALTSNSAPPRPFNARDLVRGYRIDIWSSRTGKWHSLHSRTATYRFGANGQVSLPSVDEEGFTQLAAAQPADDPDRPPDAVATDNNIPQPSTDIYIHERVARWEGWSLSAPRPGKALNRSPDPGKALDSDPTLGAPMTPFKMTASFTPKPGSLPELRFGSYYRLRVRTVDLAGNSLPVATSLPPSLNLFAAPANGAQMRYFRFEPVGPPLVVLRQNTQPGASLERLVIRSSNANLSLDAKPTTETDQRHIAPPRTALRMAEHHGVLDVNGKLNGGAAAYNMIQSRDKFEFPTQGTVPMDPNPNLQVGYLPDPIARGASFASLPNTLSNTNGQTGPGGLKYSALPDVDPRPYSVTHIDFGTQPWPNAAAFRLVLAEGTAAPQWDAKARVLTVFLPKAGMVTVPLSCWLSPADLENMGVWNWLREWFEAQEVSVLQGAAADMELTGTSDSVAQAARNVLDGGNEMITPALTLTLVHAVQQPLGQPAFLQLPVVHQPASPIYSSALRNLFSPITAWRAVGAHEAVLLGGLQIHGASSSKIELQSRWLEVTDDPSLPAPAKSTASQMVETINLGSLAAGPIFADASLLQRMVAVYIPQADVLWFAAPFDYLDGVPNPSTTDVAAPVHRFDDTRHRWVEYTPVATTRFQEYFQNQALNFTRQGPMLVVDVPSSARPSPPDIAYIVPTFGWEHQESSNVKTSVRYGGGLRVYLNRGWYSSGQDELLGVVLWPASPPTGVSPSPDYPTREQYKSLFSQWGNDPIWANAGIADNLPPVPAISDFQNSRTSAAGLTVPEVQNMVFDVAGYEVEYDAGRGLWYCDIELQNDYTYAPFVRLALARYQPHSIQGVELSPVQLADFAQIAPDRSAVLSINPNNPAQARLFIGGLAPTGPLESALQVTVESRAQNVASDLDWQEASASDVTVSEDVPAPSQSDAVLWSGSIVFAKAPPRNKFRVVIREFETIAIDAASGLITDPPGTGTRLVYAAILPFNYP